MKPQIYKEGIPVIKDINETTASISLEYQFTSQNDDEITEVYDVEEFYRMRYMDSRIWLLDFRGLRIRYLIRKQRCSQKMV